MTGPGRKVLWDQGVEGSSSALLTKVDGFAFHWFPFLITDMTGRRRNKKPDG
jgi:hypothetical protein